MEKTKDQKNELIKVKASLERVIYPTPFKGADWAIVKFNTEEVLDNDENETLYEGKELTFVGPFPNIDRRTVYTLTGKEVFNPKYGQQYQLVSFHSGYNFDSESDQRKFLNFVLTPSQVEKLYEHLSNPIEALREKDYPTLTKIPGIGVKTAIKLCKAYEDNTDNSEAYVELYEYGLTKLAMDKLVKLYKSPQLVVDKIRENPYILIEEVDGYGWAKADTLALNSGKISPTSDFRLKAFLKYFLETEASDRGNTWVSLTALRNAYFQFIPEATDEEVRRTISDLLQPISFKPEIVLITQGSKRTSEQRIALYKYYKLENEITKELKRLMSGPNLNYNKEDFEKGVREIEKRQGWSYTEEQLEAAMRTLDNPVSIITGGAGCVDMDTEYFNGTEWKRIVDYKKGEKVLQYNRDGTANLVEPLDYVKYPETNLWYIKTKYGLDMCLSEEHNVYYITSKGNLHNKSLKEIKDIHNGHGRGFYGKFITTFDHNGKGVDISDVDIELMIAAIADGSLSRHNTKSCRFNLKKNEKKAQLLDIFKRGDIPFKINKSSQEGYMNIVCDIPIKTKVFPKEWYNFNKHQKEVFINNILKWDGDNKRRFFTTIKENADFVQFIFSSMGYRATVSTHDRRGTKKITQGKGYIRKSIDYVVTITTRTLITMGGHREEVGSKTNFISYKPIDGYKYCFTMDSGMWVMRRNGRIVVTGNTGKTSSLTLVTTIHQDKKIVQTALSGRAASRMSEITALEGYTMHRLLGMKPGSPLPAKDKDDPLSADIIILDETSMVDGFMFLNLLRAIRTGAKLVMLGDINQLESIGLCNLLNDMTKSGAVPSSMLTKIHRQAAASGIISTSNKIKDGQYILPSSSWVGHETRGELRDLEVISTSSSLGMQGIVLSEYERLIRENNLTVDDIDIIVPMRKKGEISLEALNLKAQEIIRRDKPESFVEEDKVVVKSKNLYGGGYTLYVDDKIIVTRNCYNTLNSAGEDTPIYNGNTGRIKEINTTDGYMVINLAQQGDVIVEAADWHCINLGYVITCHAKQGSEVPYAIVAIDSSSYVLASKEWLYTALTRAKKHCVLIGQNSVLQRAVKISSISNKQTWLLELLTGENDEILPKL